jgi:hypothetical protein
MNRRKTNTTAVHAELRRLGGILGVVILALAGLLVHGCVDTPAVKPANQPKDIIGVMRSLKAELGKLSSAWPELSGAKDINIISASDGSAHTVAYTNNCTFTGKRGYQDTGPNACAVALRVITGKRFQKDVREVAMQAPAFTWANLQLVGWTTVHVGKQPSAGFEAQIRKLISEHVAMINELDDRAAPK